MVEVRRYVSDGRKSFALPQPWKRRAVDLMYETWTAAGSRVFPLSWERPMQVRGPYRV